MSVSPARAGERFDHIEAVGPGGVPGFRDSRVSASQSEQSITSGGCWSELR
jgi:hypothetical protein